MSGGAVLLREIFDSYHSPASLPTILSKPSVERQLKTARLTGPDWKSLYPSPVVYWKSSDFDLSLTHSLLEILPKTHFEASRVVFWSLSYYKELKPTTNRFTGRTLRGLLIQIQNISLRSSGMRRKQNFETFTFRFLSSPLFSLFLPHFFFLLLGI